MKEEETMQYLLRPMLLAVLTVVGVTLTIIPANAQSGSRALADIPFDFSVGNTPLKAGSYSIEQLQSGILALSSSDNREHQFAMTFPGDSDRQSQESHLVFIRYGSEVFLKRVSLSGNENSYELPESRREAALIRNQRSGAELSLLIQPTRRLW
jgi:hypothetical protein